MPNGMMELAYWISPGNANSPDFTFFIRINDIGIWDLVPEHWTFKSPDMETAEVMTLDAGAIDGDIPGLGGWPVVVDQNNVGNLFWVKWDYAADGVSGFENHSQWEFCGGVVRIGGAHEGGF